MDITIDSSRFSTSLMILHVLFLLTTNQFTDAQTSNTSLFTFADYTPTIPSSFVKIFTTNMELVSVSASPFDEAVFIAAAEAFYSSSFIGFVSVDLLTNSTDASNQTKVSFEVGYNYTSLTAETDATVRNTIGSLTAVKTGLEGVAAFNALYNVTTNETTFSFSGNSACQFHSCGGSYAFCFESFLGLTALCRSDCFNNFNCENNGVCVHTSSTLSPNCNCIASSTIWYIGGRCEYLIEVWMIVVFLLGFVAILCLIVLIGCLFCRMETKPKHRKYETSTHASKLKPATNQSPAAVNGQLTGLQSRNRQNGQNRTPPVNGTYNDISPIASPITSAAFVTVQESTESDSSLDTPGFHPESLLPKYVSSQPPPAPLAQNEIVLSGDLELTEDESSTSSQSGNETDPISGVESEASESYSDQPRGYDALQFPDRPRQGNEDNARYQSIKFDQSGDKGTQTNTRINIVLPDSILMHKM